MKRDSHREKLDNLADALVKDILHTSDEEIFSEITDEGKSVKSEADRIRGLLKNAETQVAKRCLATARKAVSQYQNEQRRCKIISLDSSKARRALDEVLKKHPESTQQFTLAARKGKDLSDSDVLSMLEDLQELGLYDPDTDTETNE